ncbi:MAG: YiiX/YebB-like N1pC/P60 family cysteine hydrolase [Verrucomicrobiota bacterium]
MRQLIVLLISACLTFPAAASPDLVKKTKSAAPRYDYRDGDIVFQGNGGIQGDAVRAATGSDYTHCGLIFRQDGKLMVLEAVHPVRVSTLENFIHRSLPGTFKAMRLKKPIDPAALAKGRSWAGRQVGVDYDLKFRWSDDQIYCSELVWKAYEKAGTKLCEPRPFRSYKLDAPIVRKLIEHRYGGMDKLPLDEPAVSPGDLAESKLLVEVPRLNSKK